jgi:hypothetical protein
MTTILAVYKENGECIGRCDSKCHDAENDFCDCVCGGLYHGINHTPSVFPSREKLRDQLDHLQDLYRQGDVMIAYQFTFLDALFPCE